jgi:hypothetical protein
MAKQLFTLLAVCFLQ